ncbi:MAG: MBOAT family protein [Gemmataceae bacterium]
MTFTELPFFVLVLIVWMLWRLLAGQYRAQLAILLIGSLVFYGYRHPLLLLLLLAYCVVNWWAGLSIAKNRWPRLALTSGVAFNLVVLAYWKYTPLVIRTVFGDGPPPFDIDGWVIPFGISFYAFTGIAYMVDVYRRTTTAEPEFWRYVLYSAFFPQLVAGPILRPHEFLDQLQPAGYRGRRKSPFDAFFLLGRGYFKKAVLADRISAAIDPFFAHVADPTTAGVWSLPYVVLYALQIYLDFSAYTDIARGLGLLFGFEWPENFNLPYLATSIQEFWHRWHMTLSRFLKDYLYIPLGGNRHGAWRTHVNLMATMLLGGLWHGASWSFLLWGGLHGSFLILNRLWVKTPAARWLNAQTGPIRVAWNGFSLVLTFACVCLAWCFFRLTVLAESLACVQKWVIFESGKILVGGAAELSLWLLLAGYACAVPLLHRLVDWAKSAELRERPGLRPVVQGVGWGVSFALLLLAFVLSPGGEKAPFIYFQF